jgi:diguanylate cyclase (GGDEF)-like protein
MYSGILPVSLLTSSAMALGNIAVFISISWALMEKFYLEFESNFVTSSNEGNKLTHHIENLQTEIAVKEHDVQHHAEMLQEKDEEIEYVQKRLREQATHDSVTKLINYSSFVMQFQHFFHDATRYHYPVVTLLIDIDGFSELNEKYELSVVNQTLQGVAKIINNESRNTDLVARYNSEGTFVFVMTHSVVDNAVIKAKDLIIKIQQIKIQDVSMLTITASIGISLMGASERSSNYQFILDKAEKAIERSRLEGGNSVNVFSYENNKSHL